MRIMDELEFIYRFEFAAGDKEEVVVSISVRIARSP